MYFHDKSHFQCYAAPHVAEGQEPLPQSPVPLLVPHTFTLEQTCYQLQSSYSGIGVYWYRSFTFQITRWENADVYGPDHGGKANRLVKSEHAYRTTIGRP